MSTTLRDTTSAVRDLLRARALGSYTVQDGTSLAEWVDAVEAALERVEALTWRPIETAPKDEWVLVWEDTVQFGRIDSTNVWWLDVGEDGCEGAPTHWMPLPDPPEARAQGEGGGA